jgi:hypothetical protein
MEQITPDDVFGVGYYFYQWLRRSQPDVLAQIRREIHMPAPEVEMDEEPAEQPIGDEMSPEWWARWGRGLLERVYPVMKAVMKRDYAELWLAGLASQLAEHGVTLEEIMD